MTHPQALQGYQGAKRAENALLAGTELKAAESAMEQDLQEYRDDMEPGDIEPGLAHIAECKEIAAEVVQSLGEPSYEIYGNGRITIAWPAKQKGRIRLTPKENACLKVSWMHMDPDTKKIKEVGSMTLPKKEAIEMAIKEGKVNQ